MVTSARWAAAMADELTRILIALVLQLPPSLRPGAVGMLNTAAATQSFWQPALTILLVVIVLVSLHLYAESMDG